MERSTALNGGTKCRRNRYLGSSPLGRILFVTYFISMGMSHLLNFQEHSSLLRRKGVPLPRSATILTIVMMVGGGLVLLFNWHPAVGAALLLGDYVSRPILPPSLLE